MSRLKKGPKFVLMALGVSVFVFGLYWVLNNTDLIPGKKETLNVSVARSDGATAKVEPIRVGVVTWGGYAGGQYFNRGFKASTESRFFQEYGILVEFVVLDDYDASRNAWKAGEVQLLWMTYDSYPTEVGNLMKAGYDPVAVFQADWSRGGDVIVVTYGINSASDLRNKRVAVAYGTPSHTYLLRSLEAANMTVKDINIVPVASAIDAASAFKAGSVDAAVVWSPDDQDCLKAVTGSRILSSTKDATHIIPDGFYAHRAWVQSHQQELASLIEGWLKGAAEINTNPQAKEQAIQILMKGLNIPRDFAEIAINNVRLTTYGDNVNFFDLQGTASGVVGEELYNKSARLYTQNTDLISGAVPAWRQVIDTSALRRVNLFGQEHAAEGSFVFSKPTQAVAQAEAFSTQRLTVNFPTGSAVLDPNAQTLIDMTFVPTAKAFGSSRIRIEGNTDSTGSREVNMVISEQRARAVRDYLVAKYRFDKNRFVVVGNGPDDPVASNDTEQGRAQNRRTDFELIRQ